ncbi:peptidylprolyl isomerase [Synechococcus sp. CBW1002]|uniref:peptidylprolyl isomerase n=1 Tax=unclassified Synechococcus TaxID=2626047 RepID=UPI0018CF107D|nr:MULTISPECIES: peptidylprolyl isomerase [unclassified Synechococcus]QPN60182.1 peptidylprolyl isomerase [Synechococcus sp. CBW1002]QPN66971.1 peptidylprolyl isomerase [Synechococcus sp. CBW1006]
MQLACSDLEPLLRERMQQMHTKPLPQLLHDQGLLRQWSQQHLLERVQQSVGFSAEEAPAVVQRLWDGIGQPPPDFNLEGQWLDRVDAKLQSTLQQRWQQLQLQKWLELNYGEDVESHFLARRESLEKIVYGAIRVASVGLADEIYLRLIGGEESFAALALQFSLGEERYTHGLVGPMTVDKPHPSIRQVLQTLAVGDVHPPLPLNRWYFILQLEHREPARLDEATRFQLLQELFERDLNAQLDQTLDELLPRLLTTTASEG